jgi:HopA1 effector protein family
MPAALAAWGRVLPMLAGLGIGYRAKVVSGPDLLPRRDGLVLYVAGRDRDKVPGRVAALTESVAGIGAEVSAFAEPVAPGVAVAWDPADPRPAMRGLSFGEHRASALAEAFVRHAARRADGDRGALGATVRDAFIEARIDPDEPSRNLPQ